MKKIFIFLLLSILSSCDNKYTVIISSYSHLTHSYVNSKPIIIKAPNDSIAYVKAYENYCYLLLIQEYRYPKGVYKGPRYIKLLDKDHHEITNKKYLTQLQKDSIYNMIKNQNKALFESQ